MRFAVSAAIEATHARIRQEGSVRHFTGVTTDTRKLKQGALFCALEGENFNGHDFVSAAFRKGAAGVVVAKGHSIKFPKKRWVLAVNDTLDALGDLAMAWRQQFDLPIIGVTGSNGKTTTKSLIAQVLDKRFTVLKTAKNYNNLIGVPWTLFRLTGRHRMAVIEMGMNTPGEIDRLAQITQPQIGVLTNVARAHLEGVGSLTSVGRAKAELLKRLPPDGLAVINADDPRVLKLARYSRAQVLTYGFGPNANFRGRRFKGQGFEGSSFEVKLNKKWKQIQLNIPGRYNALNALAAIAIASHFKIPGTVIAQSLKNVKLPTGRMTRIKLRNGTLIIDDCYNANPDSVLSALSILKTSKRRKIVILGDMLELGKHSRRAHREIGEATARAGANELYAVGDWSADIASGARKAGMTAAQIHTCADAKEASRMIRGEVLKGDLVLVKGSRGIHLEKVVSTIRGKKAA